MSPRRTTLDEATSLKRGLQRIARGGAPEPRPRVHTASSRKAVTNVKRRLGGAWRAGVIR